MVSRFAVSIRVLIYVIYYSTSNKIVFEISSSTLIVTSIYDIVVLICPQVSVFGISTIWRRTQ